MIKTQKQRQLATSIAIMLIALIFSVATARWSLLSLTLSVAALFSFFAACYLGFQVYLEWRNRRYDLSRLFDEPPGEPDEDEEPSHLNYCFHCGVGYPDDYPACPECGRSNLRF